MSCWIVILYYNSTTAVTISSENDMYFYCFMSSVVHYFVLLVECIAKFFIIICFVWIYNIGCCTFRWPCESLWASWFLGAEELATSGNHLFQFNHCLCYPQLHFVELLWCEVLCNLENHIMQFSYKTCLSNDFFFFHFQFSIIESLLSVSCLMWF